MIIIRLQPTETKNGDILFGHELMDQYIKAIKKYGYTYFGMDTVIDKIKLKKELEIHKTLELGFVFGLQTGGTNDIEYTATVVDVERYEVPHYEKEIPDCFEDGNKSLFKIIGLKRNHIDSSTKTVISNGNNLKMSLDNGRCSYVFVD